MRKNPKKTPFVTDLVLFVKGICMGAADVVPGVSGGTMAFILGIYEELIRAIKSFDLQALNLLRRFRVRALLDHVAWRFMLALGAGIFTAIFSLAKGLSWLLENEPVLIWSFFFGLVLASAVTVSRRIETWRLWTWILILGGAVGAYLLVGIVPFETPKTVWFLFISGALAICAMILPGISGSFVLVLLGKYHQVLQAVNQRDISTLAAVAAGAALGIIAFSRFLEWLFKNWRDGTIAFLTGLMLGSLRKVWPWKDWPTHSLQIQEAGKGITLVNVFPNQINLEVVTAFCLMALGIGIVFLLDRMGRALSRQ
jgi:putative membrane protein